MANQSKTTDDAKVGLWPCPFRKALATFLVSWCDGRRVEGKIMVRELRYFAEVIEGGEYGTPL